jgi:hypothetical protein
MLNNVDPSTGDVCNTLYFQGNGASQTQLNKYTGGRKTKATTGELMWSTGRNNLPPLDVIYYPVIGESDIADVDLAPFNNFFSVLNPIKVVPALITANQNQSDGVHVSGVDSVNGHTVMSHAIHLSEYSLGQSSDIVSLYEKYKYWLNLQGEDKKEGLIVWGASRGTLAILCALSNPEYKNDYKNVRLVVLEGAVDSIPNVLPKRFGRATPVVTHALKFFHKHGFIKYDHDNGPSPLSTVQNFPANIPVVFITSKSDTIVPPENTRHIAWELAKQNKNDVFLLELEHSTHPYYMYDNKEDHERYEQFIHAVYEKYHLAHKPELAVKGRELLDKCKLDPNNYEQECKKVNSSPKERLNK